MPWRWADAVIVAAETAVTINGAWGAAIAATVGALSDPLADGVSAAVVAHDLVNGIDRAAAGGVANDPRIVAPVGFSCGGDSDADSGDGGEDGECFFHGV